MIIPEISKVVADHTFVVGNNGKHNVFAQSVFPNDWETNQFMLCPLSDTAKRKVVALLLISNDEDYNNLAELFEDGFQLLNKWRIN